MGHRAHGLPSPSMAAKPLVTKLTSRPPPSHPGSCDGFYGKQLTIFHKHSSHIQLAFDNLPLIRA